MNQPTNLPTREEIKRDIGCRCSAAVVCVHDIYADKVLARLRPAWERMEANQRSDDDHALCVEAKDYDMIQRELKQTADRCDALRASLARKDEALRACVEALEQISKVLLLALAA